MSVFPYDRLRDPEGEELARVRAEARSIMLEFAEKAAVDVADAEVIASNWAARELQHVSEEDTTGIIVVGSTGRGPIGRLLPGGVGERLLTGSACPVAIAPRGYGEHPAAGLRRIGVALDGSREAGDALEAGRLIARSAEAQLRVITVFNPATFERSRRCVPAVRRSTSSCVESCAGRLTLQWRPRPRGWKSMAAFSRARPGMSSRTRAPSSICS